MRKTINKKSQLINQKKAIWPNPKLIELSLIIEITEISKRLSDCISALGEYGIVPVLPQTWLEILRDIKRSDEFILKLSPRIKPDIFSFMEKQQTPKEFLNNEFKDIGKTNIEKQESLEVYLIGCVKLLHLYDRKMYSLATDRDKMQMFLSEHLLLKNSCEALGYWKAKLEEMKRNKKGGGEKMKRRGEDNKEAIKIILAELKIKSLLVFKKDRELRDRFMTKAKEKTKDEQYNLPLSEKRIMDIARNVLKDEGTSLDTKPAA